MASPRQEQPAAPSYITHLLGLFPLAGFAGLFALETQHCVHFLHQVLESGLLSWEGWLALVCVWLTLWGARHTLASARHELRNFMLEPNGERIARVIANGTLAMAATSLWLGAFISGLDGRPSQPQLAEAQCERREAFPCRLQRHPRQEQWWLRG